MANSRVILHRQVPEDLAAIIDYFAERSLEVAERLPARFLKP